MSLADDLKRDIANFITDLGRAVTLQRVSPGTYDNTTGAVTGTATVSYTGKARVGNYSDTVRDGTLIRDSDRIATVQFDDATLVPVIGDMFIVDGVTYTVVNPIKVREVNATAFVYTLNIRQ